MDNKEHKNISYTILFTMKYAPHTSYKRKVLNNTSLIGPQTHHRRKTRRDRTENTHYNPLRHRQVPTGANDYTVLPGGLAHAAYRRETGTPNSPGLRKLDTPYSGLRLNPLRPCLARALNSRNSQLEQ